MTGDLALRYWRAVGTLAADRPWALGEIERCFAAGLAVPSLDGPTSGRVLTTTVGFGLDRPFMGLASLWMPWKGKVFDADAKDGRNIFTRSFRPAMRVLYPRYRDERALGADRFMTFRFATRSGPSVLDPSIEVFKIDYGLPESPRLLIRDIVDELVRIDDGLYLGQALLRWRGTFRRAAWFQLRR